MNWVDSYEDVSCDTGMIPTMGIRVLCGVGEDGGRQFYVAVDGDGAGDAVTACFMLGLAREKMQELALAGFVAGDREQT